MVNTSQVMINYQRLHGQCHVTPFKFCTILYFLELGKISSYNCGDTLQLWSKGKYGSSICGPCMCRWQVKLCDPLLTHAIPEQLRGESDSE